MSLARIVGISGSVSRPSRTTALVKTVLAGLEGYGLRIIGQVAMSSHANPENLRYLTTKRDRMGHDLHLEPLDEQL